MSVDPPPEIPRWRSFALGLLMFLSVATFGFLQPFTPLFMEASGLSRSQIGLVMGMATGSAMLAQPCIGLFSDRFDTRRLPMFLAALGAAAAYASFRHADQMWQFALLSALGSNSSMYLGAAGGVLVGRMVTARAEGGAAYVRYRVWGSVGYIVVSLLSGLLLGGQAADAALGRESLARVFLWGPQLFLMIALVALLVPDVKNPARAADPLPDRQANRLTPNLRWFLLATFFYLFGLYGATAYLGLYLKGLGATPLWVTATFAMGVLCEVLIMIQVGRWSDRYGRRPALAVAFLIMPLRLLCYIPAASPAWVMTVQSLHGLNYGIMGAISVVFINDLATNAGRGYAQSRLAATGAMATSIGPIVCGWIAQRYGMGAMFAAMSAVGAAGAFVFMVFVQESHPSPQTLEGRGPAILRPLWRALSAPIIKN